jgi:hypothetical protein
MCAINCNASRKQSQAIAAGKLFTSVGENLCKQSSGRGNDDDDDGCCFAGSVAANFDYKADSILAAREYRISVKSKLRHLDSILDRHFVAKYRIWDGLGRVESRWLWRPSNIEARWIWRPYNRINMVKPPSI